MNRCWRSSRSGDGRSGRAECRSSRSHPSETKPRSGTQDGWPPPHLQTSGTPARRRAPRSACEPRQSGANKRGRRVAHSSQSSGRKRKRVKRIRSTLDYLLDLHLRLAGLLSAVHLELRAARVVDSPIAGFTYAVRGLHLRL